MILKSFFFFLWLLRKAGLQFLMPSSYTGVLMYKVKLYVKTVMHRNLDVIFQRGMHVSVLWNEPEKLVIRGKNLCQQIFVESGVSGNGEKLLTSAADLKKNENKNVSILIDFITCGKLDKYKHILCF